MVGLIVVHEEGVIGFTMASYANMILKNNVNGYKKKLTNDIHVGRRHRRDPSQLFMLDGNESSRTCLNKSTGCGTFRIFGGGFTVILSDL